jgi:hypothetical protein
LFVPDSIIPSHCHLEHLFDQIGGSLVRSQSFDADNEVFLMQFSLIKPWRANEFILSNGEMNVDKTIRPLNKKAIPKIEMAFLFS